MATAVFSSSVIASKFRGCMIGALMGDCLGSPFEGDIRVSKRVLSKYLTNLMSDKSPQILPYTDDTCMTVSVASSLVKKREIDAKNMAEKFVAEYFNQPKRGYGMNVVDVFKALRETHFEDVFLPAKMQFDGSGSYGNGAAMRIAPIALFGHNKGEDYIMNAAEECARVTHANKNGINGAILQSLAVNAALGLDSSQDLDPVNFINNLYETMENVEMKVNIRNKLVEREVALISKLRPNAQGKDKKKPFCDSLKRMKDIYLQKHEDISAEEIAEYLGNDVSALKSVPSAIYSFLRGMKPLKDYENSNPFLRTLYFAISLGGDTDTIASMAGSIAGAYYSAAIIPEILQRRCELIDDVIKLADELFAVSQNKSDPM